MANWAKKLKRSVQQLLEGGDWGAKEQYRKMEKNGEFKSVNKKSVPTSTVEPTKKKSNPTRTDKIMNGLKQAGLSDADIAKLRGKK